MRFQLASIGLLAALFAATGGWPNPASAAEETVALAVVENGFEPSRLEVSTEAAVRLQITNRTAGAIEFESFELNRERVIQPGQTASVYLSGLTAGRYEFFDDFHQERRGVLEVK